jgi:hypothetical protein
MENLGIFFAYWYILKAFGIFLYIGNIWLFFSIHIFPSFGMLQQEKIWQP